MKNPVILITGATSGLGFSLAEKLGDIENLTLLLHGRTAESLSRIEARVVDSPANVHTIAADLSELEQVHRLAHSVAQLTDHLSVLVNNAGIGFGDGTREVSSDGHELRFAVNYLAPFALSNLLLPLLQAGANRLNPSRVINIASIGQQPVDFEDVNFDQQYDGRKAYGKSKLAMITSGFTLATLMDPAQVTVNSVHPATFMPTKLVLDSGIEAIDDLEDGRDAVMRLILDPAVANVTGEFFNGTETARVNEWAYDTETQRRLWKLSCAMTDTGSALDLGGLSN